MKNNQGTVYLLLLFIVSIISIESCKSDPAILPTTVKKWDLLEAKSIYEVPAPVGRTEVGDLTMELLSDNSLKYEFHIHNLTPGDAITGAHIHLGNAGEAGSVIINLNPTIAGSAGSGIVKDLRLGLIDTLQTKPVYFNAHSTQAPAGLIRVQIDQKVDFAMDIALSGGNEVPSVTTTATGLCVLRMTEDKTLYSKINVSNLEPNDTIRVAHIHRAAVGANGPVRVTLASSIADFGILKTTTLVDSIYNMIKTEAMYVNAHSKVKGGGLVRGQIR